MALPESTVVTSQGPSMRKCIKQLWCFIKTESVLTSATVKTEFPALGDGTLVKAAGTGRNLTGKLKSHLTN